MSQFKAAVMNSSQEITEILLETLRQEGITANAIFTHELKGKEERFDEFMLLNKPSVIIYDIALPYEENYKLFKRLIRRSSARGVAFVLTTTNKEALESLVGKTKAFEIIGKPFDLNILVNAVKSAYSKTTGEKFPGPLHKHNSS
jgi:DNA-binding response OmpR family regulator